MRLSEKLAKVVDDVKRPPIPPIGSYVASIKSHPEVEDITGRDGTIYEKYTFKCQLVSPIEVDEDDIAAFGSVAGYPFKVDFLFNTDPDEEAKAEATTFYMVTFLKACGAAAEGMSIQEAMAAAPGCQFGVDMGHRKDPNNPEIDYLDPKKTFEL